MITPDSKLQFLMNLVSVDRAFKELQNGTLVVSKLFSTGAVASKTDYTVS